MMIFLAIVGRKRYIIIAANKDAAMDAMTGYHGRFVTVRQMPEPTRPIVAMVVS